MLKDVYIELNITKVYEFNTFWIIPVCDLWLVHCFPYGHLFHLVLLHHAVDSKRNHIFKNQHTAQLVWLSGLSSHLQIERL